MSSKYDYQKELKESLIDASIMSVGLYGLSWIGSRVGIQKPTLTVNMENIGKIVIYLMISDMLKDYLKQQNIIPA